MRPSCPRCSSPDPRKNGFFNGNQLYRCRICKSQYGGGEFLHGGRFAIEVVAEAVRQYYLGLTYREAADYVMRQHRIEDTELAASTVRNWVCRWTDVAYRRTESLRVSVGRIWFLEGPMMSASGQRCWQVMDHYSRYLIAMDCLAADEEDSLPLEVIDRAMSSAKAIPGVLVCRSTLSDESFSPQIFQTIKKRFPEVKVRWFREGPDLMPDRDRPDGLPYPDRTTVAKLRRFRRPVEVQRFLRGWWVSYNFIENGPGGAAPPGLSVAEKVPFCSWDDVVRDGVWR